MEIVWRRVAIDHLAAARTYIEPDNPKAARRVHEQIVAATRGLRKHPDLGRPGRVPDTRELVVSGTPYIVVYTVIAEAIHIVAVMHGARRWPEAF